MTKEKIPQNIQELIGEIGERMVLFKLYELTHNQKNLEVFKNYSESGYDIGVRNHKTGKKVKVEVKTRQRLISTGKENNIAHFTLTQNEKDKADFLVGFWLEHNDYFIVPTSKLDSVGGGKNKDGSKKLVHKHIVTRSKRDNEYTEKSQNWLNKKGWKLILDFVSKVQNRKKG